MAFTAFRKVELAVQLKQSDSVSSRRISNLSRRVTFGLRQLVAEIASNRQFAVDTNFRQANFSKEPSILNNRYKICFLIGNGTFSSIYSTLDCLSTDVFAIKIMLADCRDIGRRETVFLRQLSSLSVTGRNYFLDLRDSFISDRKLCLVLPLMDATLLEFVKLSPENESLKSQILPELKKDTLNSSVIRCAPLRRYESSVVLNGFSYNNNNNNIHTRQDNKDNKKRVTATALTRLRQIALQITMALSVLKKENIIHGDIKPENCFLNYYSQATPDDRRQKITKMSSKQHSHSPLHSSESVFPTCSSSRDYSSNNNNNNNWRRNEQPAVNETKINGQLVYDHRHHGQASFHNGSTGGIIGSIGKNKDISSDRENMKLEDLPEDFELRIGDFGNAIHTSEITAYYSDFEFQSLPYRAPEVLYGLPFGPPADMWSFGVVLLELCLGRPLFTSKTKEEHSQSLSSILGDPSPILFCGGKYSSLLSSSSSLLVPSNAATVVGSSQFNSNSNSNHNEFDFSDLFPSSPPSPFVQRYNKIETLLSQSVTNVPKELVHFLAGLLSFDPESRLTPIEAFQHQFLSSLQQVPACLLQPTKSLASNNKGRAALALSKLRTTSQAKKKSRLSYS